MITKKQVCTQNCRYEDIRHAQIINLQDYFSIARLVESGYSYTRSKVTLSKYLPLSYALKLVCDKDYFVRFSLAQNSKHRQVLEALVYDSDSMVSNEAELSLKRLEL